MHYCTTRNSHTLFSWPRPPITVLSRIVDFTAPHMVYLSHSVMTRPARLNSRRDLGMVGIRNQVGSTHLCRVRMVKPMLQVVEHMGRVCVRREVEGLRKQLGCVCGSPAEVL
jgi:hypothetical protein